MLINDLFKKVSNHDKQEAVEKLIEYSYPSLDFYLMIVLSVAMATFGLILDNSSIVIGSMLIAPVLYPILSISMGVVMNNAVVLKKSVFTLFRGFILALITSFVVALFFSNKVEVLSSAEILARTGPSLLHAGVAVVAGFAASFALVKPKLSEMLPGVAISVALVPPLAVIGIGFAVLSLDLIRGSFLLFLVNGVGVAFTAMLVFSLMDLYTKRGAAERAVKEEDKKHHVSS